MLMNFQPIANEMQPSNAAAFLMCWLQVNFQTHS